MTFTKTSQKFGQWADSRANTVYGLGFSTEHHLAKVPPSLTTHTHTNTQTHKRYTALSSQTRLIPGTWILITNISVTLRCSRQVISPSLTAIVETIKSQSSVFLKRYTFKSVNFFIQIPLHLKNVLTKQKDISVKYLSF